MALKNFEIEGDNLDHKICTPLVGIKNEPLTNNFQMVAPNSSINSNIIVKQILGENCTNSDFFTHMSIYSEVNINTLISHPKLASTEKNHTLLIDNLKGDSIAFRVTSATETHKSLKTIFNGKEILINTGVGRKHEWVEVIHSNTITKITYDKNKNNLLSEIKIIEETHC